MTEEMYNRVVNDTASQINARLAHQLGWKDLRNGTSAGQPCMIGVPPTAAAGAYMVLPDWAGDANMALEALATIQQHPRYGGVLLQTVRSVVGVQEQWHCRLELHNGNIGMGAPVQQIGSNRVTLAEAVATTCVLWWMICKSAEVQTIPAPVTGKLSASADGEHWHPVPLNLTGEDDDGIDWSLVQMPTMINNSFDRCLWLRREFDRLVRCDDANGPRGIHVRRAADRTYSILSPESRAELDSQVRAL